MVQKRRGSERSVLTRFPLRRTFLSYTRGRFHTLPTALTTHEDTHTYTRSHPSVRTFYNLPTYSVGWDREENRQYSRLPRDSSAFSGDLSRKRWVLTALGRAPLFLFYRRKKHRRLLQGNLVVHTYNNLCSGLTTVLRSRSRNCIR